MQITLFDYNDQLQQSDDVLRQLQNLPVDGEIHIDGLTIYRTPRLYVVCKDTEFEELFHTVDATYRFINQVMEW